MSKENSHIQNRSRKMMTLQSVQMFSPIKDVQEGVIITRDNRFIKLMEFRPINFSLRSAQEQTEIISRFGSALRNFPQRFHIKITSRRSDIEPYIRQLHANMDTEPVAAVRRQLAEQIELVTRIGTTTGISRRFFLDFQYAEDEEKTIVRSPTFDTIVVKLNRDARRIARDMDDCGNALLSNNTDDYILSALYSIFAKRKSEGTHYEDRILEVITRYASAGINFNDREITIPINDFICPDRIDPAPSPAYMIIDGIYYMFCFIPGSSYPFRACAGWLQTFFSFGEGVDVDIFFEKESVEKVSTKLDLGMRFNYSRSSGADELDKDYGAVMAAQESALYIKRGIERGDELGYFAIMLTITADNQESLEWKYREIRKLCFRSDLRLKQCLFQSRQAFISTMPICKPDKSFFGKAKRNILVSQFASIYPFTSFELSDENGVMIGVNGSNNSLVFLDCFDTAKYNNANMLILGSPGGGKTYLAQLLALRMRSKGIQIFSIVALKGYEYERACAAVEGQFVRVGPDSPHTINIMEIRKVGQSFLSEDSAASRSSILIAKVQQLNRFFQLLLPDMSVDEKQLLDEALMNTYARFGITQDNSTLEDPEYPGKYRHMPILGDLHAELINQGTKAERLQSAIKRFVYGSAKAFNQQTNIDLENRYIIFDVSAMTEEMRPLGMFIATEFVWDKIKENPAQKKALFMEECWRLGSIVTEIFKIIRGYGGSAVAVTQEITDTFSQGNRDMSSTLVATSEIKVIMKTKPREAEIIGKELELSAQEIEEITSFRERGQCLLLASANHVFVQVQGNRTEHDLITTDRADYERLERQKQASLERN